MRRLYLMARTAARFTSTPTFLEGYVTGYRAHQREVEHLLQDLIDLETLLAHPHCVDTLRAFSARIKALGEEPTRADHPALREL